MRKLNSSWYQIIEIPSGKKITESTKNPPYFFSRPDIDVTYDLAAFTNSKFPCPIPLDPKDKLITLHEGHTPLIKSRRLGKKLGLPHLYFKNEGQNPTGSFKDRGTVVEVAKAIKYHAKAIVVASTGNMAASVSAYSAAAGIPCLVFVPKNTPQTKLAQSLFYGSRVIEINGAYDDAAKLAAQIAQRYNFYLAGDYSFRTEGQKSQSYEIIDQLNGQCPDWVVVPVGNGTNFYSIWKGFKELHQLGRITSLPRMLGVQIKGYDSIYSHWKNLHQTPLNGPTVATAIAVNYPTDLDKTIAALRESKGDMVTVSNSDVIPAQKELALAESILVEPSSATVIVALKKTKLRSSRSVVCLLTGNGFKDLNLGLASLSKRMHTVTDLANIHKIISRYHLDS